MFYLVFLANLAGQVCRYWWGVRPNSCLTRVELQVWWAVRIMALITSTQQAIPVVTLTQGSSSTTWGSH